MLIGRAADATVRPAFRWLVGLIAVSAAVLLLWAVYLALSLPASVSARHWPVAWTGLDVVIAAGLAATAWLAVRRDRRMAFPAVSTATLLIVDAWFDVCTAPAGSPLVMAAGLAATAWLAVRRDRRMAFPAVSTATLLVVDAWFDVCTAPAGSPLVMALADMCAEISVAAGCLALTTAVWRSTAYGAVPQGDAR